jgi:hypothetical protein
MVAPRTMRAAELLAMGDEARIELIKGEPIPKSLNGVLHTVVASRLARLLNFHFL